MTGNDLNPFFEKFVSGNEVIAFDSELAVLGYRLIRHRYAENAEGQRRATTGLLLRNEGGRLKVITPLKGYPAYGSGISPGDELISYGNNAFTPESAVMVASKWASSPLFDLLFVEKEQKSVDIRVQRRGKIRSYSLRLAEPPFERYELEKSEGEKYRKIVEKYLRG